ARLGRMWTVSQVLSGRGGDGRGKIRKPKAWRSQVQLGNERKRRRGLNSESILASSFPGHPRSQVALGNGDTPRQLHCLFSPPRIAMQFYGGAGQPLVR